MKFRKTDTKILLGKSGEHFMIWNMTKTWQGSAFVIWDRDDYIKEGEKNLEDKDIYKKMCKDPVPLISTIHETIEKIRKRGNLNADTTKQFMVKIQILLAFTCSRKYNKWLQDVPGLPVTLNCGYHAENISSFLDFHLQP